MKNEKLSTFTWIVGAILMAIFLRAILIGVFKVPTVTMMPTLMAGDFIISNKLAYGFKEKNPFIGDVVVFTRPEKTGQFFIKRIVAGPGQTFEIKNGEIILNKEKCNYKSLEKIENFEVVQEQCQSSIRKILKALTGQLKVKDFAEITLKQHEYFVLGDNRDASEDSRDWGPVLAEQISGRAEFIWLSIGTTTESLNPEKGFRFSRFLTGIK